MTRISHAQETRRDQTKHKLMGEGIGHLDLLKIEPLKLREVLKQMSPLKSKLAGQLSSDNTSSFLKSNQEAPTAANFDVSEKLSDDSSTSFDFSTSDLTLEGDLAEQDKNKLSLKGIADSKRARIREESLRGIELLPKHHQ